MLRPLARQLVHQQHNTECQHHAANQHELKTAKRRQALLFAPGQKIDTQHQRKAPSARADANAMLSS
ncbi:hypothetical protein D3C75_1197130 [compost metagenome]